MPLKRFKNVKWDKKKEFKKSLEKFDLNEETFELIDIISNKNIIVTSFNSLLREKNIDYKKHINESNLMKLYVVLALTDLVTLKNKKTMVGEIKKAIKKLDAKKPNKPDEIELVDWEEKAIKGYKLTDLEIKEFFTNNKYYEKIAEVFSNPFKDQKYYDFAYLLMMYVAMEVVFNKYNVPDDMNIFLVKLEVQQKMIDVIREISPMNFNSVIININKRFRRFDKQFFKLINRELGD